MARLRESSSIIRLPGVGDRFACADVDDREVQVVRRRDEVPPSACMSSSVVAWVVRRRFERVVARAEAARHRRPHE